MPGSQSSLDLKPKLGFTAVLAAMAGVAFGLGGCMFDLVQVHQTPVRFTASDSGSSSFQLTEPAKVSIGTGFATRLNGGTVWREVGRVDAGTVFTSKDQIVTVEASNIHEARLVVAGGALVGFFLPVEKTFVSVVPSVPLKTAPVAALTNPP